MTYIKYSKSSSFRERCNSANFANDEDSQNQILVKVTILHRLWQLNFQICKTSACKNYSNFQFAKYSFHKIKMFYSMCYGHSILKGQLSCLWQFNFLLFFKFFYLLFVIFFLIIFFMHIDGAHSCISNPLDIQSSGENNIFRKGSRIKLFWILPGIECKHPKNVSLSFRDSQNQIDFIEFQLCWTL